MLKQVINLDNKINQGKKEVDKFLQEAKTHSQKKQKENENRNTGA